MKHLKLILSIFTFILGTALIFAFDIACAGCKKSNSNSIQSIFISYKVSDNGKIKGEELQIIKYGEDAEEVTAVADKGYYFLKWSDGITTATRQDKNITEDFEVIAEFAEITDGVVINYRTSVSSGFLWEEESNQISREIKQIVQRNKDSWTIEARAVGGENGGLVFIKWSDGITTSIRQDKNITESFDVTAIFGYPINYTVKGNGQIIGESNQLQEAGQDASTVTALPDKGYTFVGWSDGVKTSSRTDKNVTKAIDVVAEFEWREIDNFIYHYNYATGNYNEDFITLARGEVDKNIGIVPVRDYFKFEGWYLDENFTAKAIDEEGNIFLGEEIFNSSSRDLYAKWEAEEEYIATYKILIVYVTAIDAELLGNDGTVVDVHYRMSVKERQLCNEITDKFSDTLNEMLDGLVRFEVKSYFTERSIDEQSIENRKDNTFIHAYRIPELSEAGLLKDYRSLLTVFSFGGEQNLLPSWSGIGGLKYAAIPLDEAFRLIGSVDQAFEHYNNLIGTFVHEFIHTIEQSITCYEYHKAYSPVVPEYIEDKLYLLNQYPADYYGLTDETKLIESWRNSVKVGIPYAFWTNEIFEVTIKPECINGRPDGYGGVGTVDDGGYIYIYFGEPDWWRADNDDNYYGQLVPKGSRTTVFTVNPKKGYKFIGWSDGVQDETRIIYDVQENITLIAYFERLSFTAEYIASEGGRIEGDSIQTLLTGETTKPVTAVAEEGYRFVGWSDGWIYSTRSDQIGQNKFDESGNLFHRLGFSVEAIFEKID